MCEDDRTREDRRVLVNKSDGERGRISRDGSVEVRKKEGEDVSTRQLLMNDVDEKREEFQALRGRPNLRELDLVGT